jgi:streptomycin 6-kinase
MTDLAIPDEVVRMNLAANGEAGRAWLEALPRVVQELRALWELTIGQPFEGGCVGLVVPAERVDGTRVVLKVSFIDDETRHEADALALWGGDGAVRLLDSDPERGALLLERIEPGTVLGDHPDRDEAISIACRLLRRLWRPVAEPHPFPSVRGLAQRWVIDLPQRFDRLRMPFEIALLRTAEGLSAELASSTVDPVLANRDYHLGNILAARREPWLLIDPKPLTGEPAFDTGHFLRTIVPEDLDRTVVGQLVDRLGAELDVAPERVRAWALLRSVDDVLWSLETFGSDDIEWDLACARVLARSL